MLDRVRAQERRRKLGKDTDARNFRAGWRPHKPYVPPIASILSEHLLQPASRNVARNEVRGHLRNTHSAECRYRERLSIVNDQTRSKHLWLGLADAYALGDIVREYALETLGDQDAVLVIDETGFLKQGKASCGVAR